LPRSPTPHAPQARATIGRVTLADEEDTHRAIAAAKRAFATYSASTLEERANILRRLHGAASARLDDLTAAMVEEYGGVVQFAGPIVQSGVAAVQPSTVPAASRPCWSQHIE
jgi:aldehyde dehydrogenase (NAD+)